MADPALLLELLRELRTELREARADIRHNTTEIGKLKASKAEASTVADLKTKQGDDDAIKRLIIRYLPWILAALGIGGGLGGGYGIGRSTIGADVHKSSQHIGHDPRTTGRGGSGAARDVRGVAPGKKTDPAN